MKLLVDKAERIQSPKFPEHTMLEEANEAMSQIETCVPLIEQEDPEDPDWKFFAVMDKSAKSWWYLSFMCHKKGAEIIEEIKENGENLELLTMLEFWKNRFNAYSELMWAAIREQVIRDSGTARFVDFQLAKDFKIFTKNSRNMKFLKCDCPMCKGTERNIFLSRKGVVIADNLEIDLSELDTDLSDIALMLAITDFCREKMRNKKDETDE